MEGRRAHRLPPAPLGPRPAGAARIGLAALALAAAALLCWSARPAAAASFEPDDSTAAAFGPLALGQTYGAAIETPVDRDFYYFYVTVPGTAQITLTAQNLGGNAGLSGINAAILDATATPVRSLPYLGDGETRTTTVDLPPQKYFVEVTPSEGSGDAYSLVLGGAAGSVGPYTEIASRCSAAGRRVQAAEVALNRAESKLQRATARLAGSRYATAAAKTAARAAVRGAKARSMARVRRLRMAKHGREPWCTIAQ
ncbi:MAG: hypothetical protein H0X42_12405 [Solirubrobacterales bacterium]|nr:hypothetical protein [Solirubrobacterales bacterium]